MAIHLLVLSRFLLFQAALLPGVEGSCLPNAIPEDRRQDIMVKGTMMPLGIWEHGWESAAMVAYITKILSEEMLGLKTKMTAGTISPENGIIAVAMCANPMDGLDPQCDTPVSSPTEHLALEWWPDGSKYTIQWFQDNWPEIAPTQLGEIGYVGVQGMRLHEATVIDSVAATGQNLQWYCNYNSSWFTPSPYFEQTTTIPDAKLNNCSNLVGLCGGEYARMAADYDDAVGNGGFELRSGQTCAACSDDKWWRSPSCRASPSTCIPLVTAGSGWLINEFIEKVLAYNMPVAVATTLTWEDYLWVFPNRNVLSYDWIPGVHFGNLKSLDLGFPRNNASEFKAGIMRTMAADSVLEKHCWRGLETAAPDAFFLGKNLEMTMTDMNNMITHYVALGTDQYNYSGAACLWLRDSEDIWRNWLPESDATRCSSGHGMADGNGLFTDNRSLAVECKPCPTGHMSRSIIDPRSATYECVLCRPGEVQPMWGQDHCIACDPGFYQDKSGLDVCELCDLGSYTDARGLATCTECPGVLTTKVMASSNISACLCPEKSYQALNQGSATCTDCPEGMICPVGSREANFGTTDGPLPLLEVGFYSFNNAPLDPYRCMSDEACIGGMPESCAPNHGGLTCSICDEGFALSSDKTCTACGAATKGGFLYPVLPLVIGPPVILAVYKFSQDDVEKWGLPRNGLASMAFLIFINIQTIGSSKMVDMVLPTNSLLPKVQGAFASTLSIDSILRPACAIRGSIVGKFVLRLLTPFWALVVFGIVFGTFRALPFLPNLDIWVMISVYGALFNTFFITIAGYVASLFQCYVHPNGKFSVVEMPQVICFEQGEWTAMVGFAVVGALIFLVAPIALFVYLIVLIPKRFSESRNFRISTKFVARKFCADRAWWTIALLLKGLWINFTKIFFVGPVGQILWLNGGLLAYTTLTMLFMPWRHYIVSFIDFASHCILTFFFTTQAFLAVTSSAEQADISYAAMGILFFDFVVLGAGVGFLLYKHLNPPSQEDLDTQAKNLCKVLSRFAKQPDRVSQLLLILPGYEMHILKVASKLIQRESDEQGLVVGKFLSREGTMLSRGSTEDEMAKLDSNKASTPAAVPALEGGNDVAAKTDPAPITEEV